MANPASPFTPAAVTTIVASANTKVVLKIEDITSVSTLIKVNGTPQASDADYVLSGGNAVEIIFHDNGTVNVLNATGTPKVYYRIETLSPYAA